MDAKIKREYETNENNGTNEPIYHFSFVPLLSLVSYSLFCLRLGLIDQIEWCFRRPPEALETARGNDLSHARFAGLRS
jgi:hypothetical protein